MSDLLHCSLPICKYIYPRKLINQQVIVGKPLSIEGMYLLGSAASSRRIMSATLQNALHTRRYTVTYVSRPINPLLTKNKNPNF